jgi:hypothetical protein
MDGVLIPKLRKQVSIYGTTFRQEQFSAFFSVKFRTKFHPKIIVKQVPDSSEANSTTFEFTATTPAL